MRAKISGVALLMERFDFFFGICLGRVLFRHTDNLSKALQKKDVSASEGQPLASMVKSMLTCLHSDASFELFWESVNAKSQLLEVNEPRLPRKRKQPQRFETCNAPAEFHGDTAAHYWAVYYESLDLLIQCIADRFDQSGYKM